MGSEQRFSLRWNNYQSHLVSAFESFRGDNDFVDVTLSCEGKKLPSHKMLLSACSPYFRDLLKDNPCPHPIIILRETRYEDIVAILEFIYNGEVNVHQDTLPSFLRTAEAFKIRGLTETTDESPGTNEEIPHPPPPQGAAKRKRLEPKNYFPVNRMIPPLPPLLLKRPQEPTPTKELVPEHQSSFHQTNSNSSNSNSGPCDNDHDNSFSESTRRYSTEDFDEPDPSALVETTAGPSSGADASLDSSGGGGNFSCDECHKSFKHPQALVNHRPVHRGETVCPVCKIVASTKGNLKTHMKHVHKFF